MARVAIHPGDQLAEELRALEMSAAELARASNSRRRIADILSKLLTFRGEERSWCGGSPQDSSYSWPVR